MFDNVLIQIGTLFVLACLVGVVALVFSSIHEQRRLKKLEKQSVFLVTVHCDGKHPYLTDGLHDKPTQDVEVKVLASNWTDAATKAQWLVATDSQIYAWSYKTIKVKKG